MLNSAVHGENFDQILPESSILQNRTPEQERQLRQLSDALGNVLAAIKAGEWERFAELVENTAPTMDAVQSAATLGNLDSAKHRLKIEAILTMLELATQGCLDRKEQISPLIDALNAATARTEKT